VARRLVLAIATALTVLLTGGSVLAATTDRVLYSEALASGWQNWSWKSTVNFWASGAFWGARSIEWQINGAWAGLYLHTDAAVQTSSGSTVQFALMATQSGQRVLVSVAGANWQQVGNTRSISEFGGDPVAWQWKYYTIPLSSLGAAGQKLTGVILQDGLGRWQPKIKVDEVKLAGLGVTTVSASTSGSGNCLGVPWQPEVRWENNSQNSTAGRPTQSWKFYGDWKWRAYYDKINGACTGTTEQILEWAAKKWGFDQIGYPDLAKAMGVIETWWRQAFVGNSGEVGILQVHPGVWPDWEPAKWSTAYGADYAMAVVRAYYDGSTWLGSATKGRLRDSVAAWNCGCPYNGGGWYASNVFKYNDTKPWNRPSQPPEWF
jgi:hypothetical protein